MAFKAALSISFPYTGIPHDEGAYRDQCCHEAPSKHTVSLRPFPKLFG